MDEAVKPPARHLVILLKALRLLQQFLYKLLLMGLTPLCLRLLILRLQMSSASHHPG